MSDEVAIRRNAQQDHDAARADATARLGFQYGIADAALKALVLTNGGALVALFTFVGNVVDRSGGSEAFDAGRLWTAFAMFVAGLVAALLCHALAFLSQDRFYNQSAREAWRQQRIAERGEWEGPTQEELSALGTGHAMYGLGILVALISVALFAIGCGFALAGVL